MTGNTPYSMNVNTKANLNTILKSLIPISDISEETITSLASNTFVVTLAQDQSINNNVMSYPWIFYLMVDNLELTNPDEKVVVLSKASQAQNHNT